MPLLCRVLAMLQCV